MQTFQKSRSSGTTGNLYHQPIQKQYSSHFQVLNNNPCPCDATNEALVSLQSMDEQFFTLESFPASDSVVYDSPTDISTSSNRSPFSPQCSSQSHVSNPNPSPRKIYRSPLRSLSLVNGGNEVESILREIEFQLLGAEYDIDDGCVSSFNTLVPTTPPMTEVDELLQILPTLDLKHVLSACAQAVDDDDREKSVRLVDMLERMVSVSGEPIQRLGAYLLEGLRARVLSSGSTIYKKLKCREPTGPELISYMRVLYEICPYYKFAYTSSNVIIEEAMANEKHIHIIDFLIAQGSQWVFLMQALAARRGGPPSVRITGIDDSDSSYAREGGIHLVGQRLSKVAESLGIPFQFHGAAISGSEVYLENLRVQPGEALAVNFPYMLHHMPDESVNTMNHRDRLLQLIKFLSPRVVTLLEQESNTNTSSFCKRFEETMDYYTAMFEGIDAARPRDDKQRISAEEHCVARDIVNIVACEGADRVERHEPFGKWRYRFSMAGYIQLPLSFSVGNAVNNVLKEYSSNYRLGEKDGGLFLFWKNRPMVTCSAWR